MLHLARVKAALQARFDSHNLDGACQLSASLALRWSVSQASFGTDSMLRSDCGVSGFLRTMFGPWDS